ncbi:hypothetical protein MHBO_004512 [Bonamia ostreae]|uniref:Translation initiation factor 5A-like N-terminal domain-containing protein n=1 Tax=Bonamia ostreae TaxID=126728 RepID=A0ABV2ATJ7_9EUKA
MSLLPNARTLPAKSGEDIESRLEPKTAHEVKNGEWIIDPKSGFPGIVSNIKASKTGKHGHIKVTFQCDMPFSGKTSSLMHAGGDRLLSPRMERKEFSVSDYNDGEITVLDDNGDERYITCSEESEVGIKLMGIIEDGEVGSLTVLIGPQKKGSKTAELVEMPEAVKVQN